MILSSASGPILPLSPIVCSPLRADLLAASRHSKICFFCILFFYGITQVREHHQRKLTELASINTRDQLSDQLTKTNTGPQVRRLRDWMLRGCCAD